jgi:hypothetical protein
VALCAIDGPPCPQLCLEPPAGLRLPDRIEDTYLRLQRQNQSLERYSYLGRVVNVWRLGSSYPCGGPPHALTPALPCRRRRPGTVPAAATVVDHGPAFPVDGALRRSLPAPSAEAGCAPAARDAVISPAPPLIRSFAPPAAQEVVASRSSSNRFVPVALQSRCRPRAGGRRPALPIEAVRIRRTPNRQSSCAPSSQHVGTPCSPKRSSPRSGAVRGDRPPGRAHPVLRAGAWIERSGPPTGPEQPSPRGVRGLGTRYPGSGRRFGGVASIVPRSRWRTRSEMSFALERCRHQLPEANSTMSPVAPCQPGGQSMKVVSPAAAQRRPTPLLPRGACRCRPALERIVARQPTRERRRGRRGVPHAVPPRRRPLDGEPDEWPALGQVAVVSATPITGSSAAIAAPGRTDTRSRSRLGDSSGSLISGGRAAA